MDSFRRGRGTVAALGLLFLAACGGGGGDSATPTAVAGAGEEEAVEVVEKAPLPAPPVLPLFRTGVPDVNWIGFLDGEGTGFQAGAWAGLMNAPVTKPNMRTELQRLGKALFWDMQVGGDGIQSCASCHYHAGADHRKVNQVSPGFKGGDWTVELPGGLNATLTTVHYRPGQPRPGFASSEVARQGAGAQPDALDGVPGLLGGKPATTLDVDDVGSSQGVRKGAYLGLAGRADAARLDTSDQGFDKTFPARAPGIPPTVRRVEPRNAPSVLNAVYNLRNFWDGRADAYFNGVTPLGFRDPDQTVRVHTGGALSDERLLIPFSALASQAVGPLGSEFEMIYRGRPLAELGRKLTRPGVVPLAGQAVHLTDDLLGSLRDPSGRGLATTYAQLIKAIFAERFWGDGQGNEVCVTEAGASAACDSPAARYTLMQYNFALFFGLAVQAYEATLFTEKTLVDLIAGGVATGTLANGRLRLDVRGVSLEGCIAGLRSTARGALDSTRLCGYYYASFINDTDMDAGRATSGTESGGAPFPVIPGSRIDQCQRVGNAPSPVPANPNATPIPLASAYNCERAFRTLMNVERGLGRWFAGATGCSVCHLNAEFTGATVSTMTGFGAPVEVLPPGQLRRMERRAVLERMVLANGTPAVYDTGFYNIAVRPTGEDISLGDAIGGIPLSYAKIMEIGVGGVADTGNAVGVTNDRVKVIDEVLPLTRTLLLPTSPDNLAPMPFPWAVGCGVGLNGGANRQGDGNPNANCVGTMIAGERIQRNGSFKTPSIRNTLFTGPYLHNGSKMNLRQVLEFYKTSGHFPNLNANNLDAGMRIVDVGPTDEAALVELMEVGLTDWRVAFKKGKFSHPELCITNGHDETTGRTRIVGIPAVGAGGGERLQTYQEHLEGITLARSNTLLDACTVPGIVETRSPNDLLVLTDLDVPPPVVPPATPAP